MSAVPLFPEQGLRDFYDPKAVHRKQSFEAFLADVAAAQPPVYFPGLGMLTGESVVLVAALHAGLEVRFGENGYERGVPLQNVSEERQTEVSSAVTREVHRQADRLLDVSSRFHNMLQERATSPAIPSLTVVSSQAIAAVAHDGEERATGRGYFWHTDDVVKDIEIALDEVGITDERERSHQLSVGATHDGFEQVLHKHQLLVRWSYGEFIASPLLLETVLLSLDDEEAREISQANLLLTRTAADDDGKMPYGRYIDNGVINDVRRFSPAKLADLNGNGRIEPDPRLKSQERLVQARTHYGPAEKRIMREVRKELDPQFIAFCTAIRKVSRAQIEDRRRAAIRGRTQMNPRRIARAFNALHYS